MWSAVKGSVLKRSETTTKWRETLAEIQRRQLKMIDCLSLSPDMACSIVRWIDSARQAVGMKRFCHLSEEFKRQLELSDGTFTIDLTMLQPDALIRRRKLRNNEKVVSAISRWWDSIEHNNETTRKVISRDYYIWMSTILIKILLPELEVKECALRILADWNYDSRGRKEIDQQVFFDSIFMMADSWTEEIGAEIYSTFIDDLHSGVLEVALHNPFKTSLDYYEYLVSLICYQNQSSSVSLTPTEPEPEPEPEREVTSHRKSVSHPTRRCSSIVKRRRRSSSKSKITIQQEDGIADYHFRTRRVSIVLLEGSIDNEEWEILTSNEKSNRNSIIMSERQDRLEVMKSTWDEQPLEWTSSTVDMNWLSDTCWVTPKSESVTCQFTAVTSQQLRKSHEWEIHILDAGCRTFLCGTLNPHNDIHESWGFNASCNQVISYGALLRETTLPTIKTGDKIIFKYHLSSKTLTARLQPPTTTEFCEPVEATEMFKITPVVSSSGLFTPFVTFLDNSGGSKIRISDPLNPRVTYQEDFLRRRKSSVYNSRRSSVISERRISRDEMENITSADNRVGILDFDLLDKKAVIRSTTRSRLKEENKLIKSLHFNTTTRAVIVLAACSQIHRITGRVLNHSEQCDRSKVITNEEQSRGNIVINQILLRPDNVVEDEDEGKDSGGGVLNISEDNKVTNPHIAIQNLLLRQAVEPPPSALPISERGVEIVNYIIPTASRQQNSQSDITEPPVRKISSARMAVQKIPSGKSLSISRHLTLENLIKNNKIEELKALVEMDQTPAATLQQVGLHKRVPPTKRRQVDCNMDPSILLHTNNKSVMGTRKTQIAAAKKESKPHRMNRISAGVKQLPNSKKWKHNKNSKREHIQLVDPKQTPTFPETLPQHYKEMTNFITKECKPCNDNNTNIKEELNRTKQTHVVTGSTQPTDVVKHHQPNSDNQIDCSHTKTVQLFDQKSEDISSQPQQCKLQNSVSNQSKQIIKLSKVNLTEENRINSGSDEKIISSASHEKRINSGSQKQSPNQLLRLLWDQKIRAVRRHEKIERSKEMMSKRCKSWWKVKTPQPSKGVSKCLEGTNYGREVTRKVTQIRISKSPHSTSQRDITSTKLLEALVEIHQNSHFSQPHDSNYRNEFFVIGTTTPANEKKSTKVFNEQQQEQQTPESDVTSIQNNTNEEVSIQSSETDKSISSNDDHISIITCQPVVSFHSSNPTEETPTDIVNDRYKQPLQYSAIHCYNQQLRRLRNNSVDEYLKSQIENIINSPKLVSLDNRNAADWYADDNAVGVCTKSIMKPKIISATDVVSVSNSQPARRFLVKSRSQLSFSELRISGMPAHWNRKINSSAIPTLD